MTREELIRNLKYTMKKHENDKVPTFGTNISMMCKDILDYLEQEPCEDAINRQALLNMYECLDEDSRVYAGQVVRDIKALPPVTPTRKKGKWIFAKTVFDRHGWTVECSSCHKRWKTYDEKGIILWHNLFK